MTTAMKRGMVRAPAGTPGTAIVCSHFVYLLVGTRGYADLRDGNAS